MKKILLVVMLLFGMGSSLSANDYEVTKNACDGGNALACTSLGDMYAQGKGVKQDYFKAAEVYDKACDGGSARGCSNLGIFYEKGLGGKKDFVKAAESYKKGCDGGHMRGCYNLGNSYYYGKGVEQDLAKSIKLYTKGYNEGDMISGLGLGVTYAAMGDYEKAKIYFKESCEAGIPQGCEYYEKIIEEYSSIEDIPTWALIALPVVFLILLIIMFFSRKNEKVQNFLSWVIGVPLIFAFWYFSSWLHTWWTAFKLEYFGF